MATTKPYKPFDIYLRRQIRWVLLVRVILFSLILGASSVLQEQRLELNIPPLSVILAFIFTVYLFSISSEFFLRKTNKFKSFALLQTLSDAFFISILVYFTGGINSIFSITYFFPIVSSGILLSRTGGLTVASINILLFGSVLFAEYIPYLRDLPSPYAPSSKASLIILLQALSVYGLSFFLTAILSSFLSERFRSTTEKLSKTALDLDRLNQLYKQIFNDISSGIITIDTDESITSFNMASEEITGYRHHEVIGKKLYDIFPALHASLENQVRQSTTLIKKNNDQTQIGYSWAKLNMPGDSEDCRVFTIQDINKIKEMEAKVQQAEKMAAIGEIAAGIAHEFRNPLAAISGATQILNQDEEQSETNKSLLTIIGRECRRLERNINDFLQFSKPSVPEKKWLSISTLIEESISVIRQIPGINETCQITCDIPQNLDCWADHHQFRQIFINLIHNALQAMQNSGGNLVIKAHEVVESDGQEKTKIEFIDDGPGINERVLSNIFEPFFTTKENGTGLGLAIVKQIIESHDGSIHIASVVREGTTVTITLPIPASEDAS